jgi:glycopeptide antibiotics resistance protein
MTSPTSAIDRAVTGEASIRRSSLFLVALAYSLFVVYGSLVPLDFQALPLGEAIARFRQIRFLQLGIGSRADWMANLLLFIPLAFLWTGALAHRRGPVAGVVASVLVAGGAVVLSLAIEFTQLYFPQRTVSLNDLYAETLGGLIGIGLWWAFGARFADWLGGWRRARSHLELAQRLTLVYLLLLFGYSLLPLDLTISPVEVYHKFRDGKLNLLPFARLPAQPVHALYELGSDSLLWLVPALLWRWSGRASSLKVWVSMAGAALLLEILQLFVYSRISDITDLFTAAAGAGLGTWLAGMARKQPSWQRSAAPGVMPIALPLLLAAVWTILVLAVFWYPFEFRTDGAFLRGRLQQFLTRVPFEAYYFGTEYRAATEVMHKVLFFVPLGVLLGWFVSHLRYLWRGYATAAALLVVGGIALLAVGGRLAQAEKNPDIMDVFLQWLGGGLGFATIRILLGRTLPAGQGRKPAARTKAGAS